MKIAPFEIKEYIFFRKTREKMFYKLTELKLNLINQEMDRLKIEKAYMKPGRISDQLINNINENLEYLQEVKADIIYFRKHDKMRSKKHSTYGKYYKAQRA